jgi:hypothetical protein
MIDAREAAEALERLRLDTAVRKTKLKFARRHPGTIQALHCPICSAPLVLSAREHFAQKHPEELAR